MRGFNTLAKLIFTAALLSSILSGCASQPTGKGDQQAYHSAVVDAAFPTDAKLSHDLIPVTQSNKELAWNDGKILVVSWKSEQSYEKYLKPFTHTPGNIDYAIWVTTAPQVKTFCANYLKRQSIDAKARLEHRLHQYLGLNPDWEYDVFVEMWVDPTDLFRPCVDPDPSDTVCNLHFNGTTPSVKGIPDYQQFYTNLYYKSYRASTGVPWTGIGYTYDWGNQKHPVGASEFILVPNAAYTIKDVTPTMDYCQDK